MEPVIELSGGRERDLSPPNPILLATVQLLAVDVMPATRGHDNARWRSRAFTMLTRRGRVLRKVKEHYLRDDLGCGTICRVGLDPIRIEKLPEPPVSVKESRKSRESSQERVGEGAYLILDTNVVLKQMDLLEHEPQSSATTSASAKNRNDPVYERGSKEAAQAAEQRHLNATAGPLARCIFLQTVVDEVKHQNLSIFNRLQSLVSSGNRQHIIFANEHHRETYVKDEHGESPNDRNDRAIRVATQWFIRNHGHEADIVLITNDRANKQLARKEGIPAMSIQEYVRDHTVDFPELADLIAGGVGDDSNDASAVAVQRRRGGLKQRSAIFEAHLPMSQLASGLVSGKYFQGSMRVNDYNSSEGKVKVRSETITRPIVISGREHMNRAFDGDIVAVELLPKSEWGKVAKSTIRIRDEETGAEIDGGEGDQDPDQERTASVWKGDLLGGNDGAERDYLQGEETGSIASADAAARAGHGSVGGQQLDHSVPPRGRVVGIITRKWRSYCGSLEPLSKIAQAQSSAGQISNTSSRCLFIPVKRNVPKIRISTRQGDALRDMRILVCVDEWDRYSAYPTGHYVRTLGPIGDRETETQVVLIEHNIPTAEFSPRVMACLPDKDWTVTPDKLAAEPTRKDLRHITVCSIDPPGCKDIDDALHARYLPNGNLECGVHIADVTHFVKHGSAIDVEAADRSTSTYLVERRLDMLPGLLTTHLCSLRGGIDRFCFSCIWELDPDTLEVIRVDFHKSVIHSRAALTYDQAQLMLDDPDHQKGEVPDAVRALNRVAVRLRAKRMEAGALTLASPEVRFKLDSETQDPTDVKMYNLKQANALVEEFMLFANITVARKITQTFPRYALLRRHPVPQRQNFDGLIAAAAVAGVEIRVDTSKELAESLDAADLGDEHPYFNKLLRIMATRCMSQAVYFCSGELSEAEYRHYGLATPIYTHFTSPIRRYADVVVHRLLSAAIGLEALPDSYEDKDGMRLLTENMNYRHHMAQMAGRASVTLHTLLYFKDRPTVETACVMRVKSNGAVVLVPRFGIEGPVYVAPKGEEDSTDKYYRFDEKGMALVHLHDNSKSLRVFDEVKVKIEVVETGPHRKALSMSLFWEEDRKVGRTAQKRGGDEAQADEREPKRRKRTK